MYTDKPNAEAKAWEGIEHGANLAYSIGLNVNDKGRLTDVQWNGPAFAAGLVPGLSIVAVNGHDFSTDALKDAITAAKGSSAPIELLVKNVDVYSTVKIDYHQGLRYPHLVRADGKDLLDDILKPRKRLPARRAARATGVRQRGPPRAKGGSRNTKKKSAAGRPVAGTAAPASSPACSCRYPS